MGLRQLCVTFKLFFFLVMKLVPVLVSGFSEGQKLQFEFAERQISFKELAHAIVGLAKLTCAGWSSDQRPQNSRCHSPGHFGCRIPCSLRKLQLFTDGMITHIMGGNLLYSVD